MAGAFPDNFGAFFVIEPSVSYILFERGVRLVGLHFVTIGVFPPVVGDAGVLALVFREFDPFEAGVLVGDFDAGERDVLHYEVECADDFGVLVALVFNCVPALFLTVSEVEDFGFPEGDTFVTGVALMEAFKEFTKDFALLIASFLFVDIAGFGIEDFFPVVIPAWAFTVVEDFFDRIGGFFGFLLGCEKVADGESFNEVFGFSHDISYQFCHRRYSVCIVGRVY